MDAFQHSCAEQKSKTSEGQHAGESFPEREKEKSGAKVSTPIRKACHSRKNNRRESELAATWQVATQANK